jgi:K+:H+ antiporter
VSPDPLLVVYVSTTRDKGSRRGRTSISLGREEAILKDTAVAAARYNIDVRTALRAHSAPEQAILQEIQAMPISWCLESTALRERSSTSAAWRMPC